MTIVLIIWIVLLAISVIAGTTVGIYQCKKDSTASNTNNTKDNLDDDKYVAPAGEHEIVDLSYSDIHGKSIAAANDRTNKTRTGKKENRIREINELDSLPVVKCAAYNKGPKKGEK